MPPTRREFNQGLIATAVAAAVPLIPTPAQADRLDRYQPREMWECVRPEEVDMPGFCVQLIETHNRTSLWRLTNFTDYILRVQGYDGKAPGRHPPAYLVQLMEREVYGFATPSWFEPRFDLVAAYLRVTV